MKRSRDLGIASANEFYGFPPSLDFNTGVFGPFSGDVSCYHDRAAQRWFHLMFSIEQDPATGALSLVEDNMDTRKDLTRWLATLFVLPAHRGEGRRRSGRALGGWSCPRRSMKGSL